MKERASPEATDRQTTGPSPAQERAHSEIFACYMVGLSLKPIDTGEFSRHGYCGSAKEDPSQVSTGTERVKIVWQSIMKF
jgi:hypothetical protein